MMTILELSNALDERDLSMTIWSSSPEQWSVWLFAKDDPALGAFIGDGDDLETVIRQVLSQWDGERVSNEQKS